MRVVGCECHIREPSGVQLGDLGSVVSSPVGEGGAPAASDFFVYIEHTGLNLLKCQYRKTHLTKVNTLIKLVYLTELQKLNVFIFTE